MKKYLVAIMVITGLLVTGVVVYAETEDLELPEWFTEMMTEHREDIDKAVEDGSLSEEEAESWLEHIDEMEAFHLEEGFGFGGESCPGRERDWDRDNDRGFGGCRRGNFSE